MGCLIVLNFGQGGQIESGYATVSAQLWEADRAQPMQFVGSLPSAPGLGALYQRWRSGYQGLYAHLSGRGQPIAHPEAHPEFEVDKTDVTHISLGDFENLCEQLQRQLNAWLKVESFQRIERQLRTYLNPIDEIRLIIVTEDANLLQLPWHLWQFLTDYPHAEIALSPPEYARSRTSALTTPHTHVKILAILGDSQGIDVARDRRLLEQLPNAEVCFLVEPTTQALTEHLWEPGWDILFFAGHSSSQGKGTLQINPTERLSIDQLKYSLRSAIGKGLKLAIFNSCDGLGLARALADLYLPQVIVMREPVPDRVAQRFLKYFLAAFSSGQSLYRSVRQAREQLQAIETEFPCATWLPVICQNPAEEPPRWQDWYDRASKQAPEPPSHESQAQISSSHESPSHESQAQTAPSHPRAKSRLAITVLSTLCSFGLISLVRGLGGLQSLELAVYDQFLRSRPIELPDPRLLIVTVTDQDIQAQGSQPRRGSLSDRTLDQLLKTLESAKPRVIGLDIYRDFPTPERSLAQQLKTNDRLIGICKRPDPQDNPTGILPPPEMPESQIGFSDFVQDRDATLRRQLVTMTPNPTSHCTAAYAFSTQLALRYLAESDITASFNSNADLQLHDTLFKRLRDRFSGYQSIDTRGLQLLLNYRQTPSPKEIAPQVTLTELLQGQVNPGAIADRIVLVGVTSATSGDNWSTPYGQEFTRQVPGVMIQAHMTSQILSAVLDRRPLFWAWAMWQEQGWIMAWAILGAVLGVRLRPWLGLLAALLGAFIILLSMSWILFLQGGWIAIAPALIALLLSSLAASQLSISKLSASKLLLSSSQESH